MHKVLKEREAERSESREGSCFINFFRHHVRIVFKFVEESVLKEKIPGHAVYKRSRGGTLWLQRFDKKREKTLTRYYFIG